MKDGSTAQFAFNPDPAAPKIDQAFHNRQTEATAPIAPSRRRVCLSKICKDIFKFVGGDSDPRIRNGKVKFTWFRRAWQASHGNDHLPRASKFYRIAQQIDQYLAQPQRIS